MVLFFDGYRDHRDLHVLTHPFPTRRSSDLIALQIVHRTTVGETHGMGDILGYARVSTGDQDVSGQTMRLEKAGAIKVFTDVMRSEEHTSELPSLMRISYAAFCL